MEIKDIDFTGRIVRIIKATIIDDNGYEWVYDREAKRELRTPNSDSVPNNGHTMSSFDEALIWLKEGGYIL